MLTKTVGNVTIDFKPLVIAGIIISIILLFHIFRSIILELKFRKVYKSITSGEYDSVISIGKKILRLYQKYNARLSTKQITAKIEYLNFSLAISYFAKSDYGNFLVYINALISSPDTKAFWLSLYHLQENNYEEFQEHYNRIELTEKNLVNITMLDAIRDYNEHNMDDASKKISEIINQLKHPILKQIASQILDRA